MDERFSVQSQSDSIDRSIDGGCRTTHRSIGRPDPQNQLTIHGHTLCVCAPLAYAYVGCDSSCSSATHGAATNAAAAPDAYALAHLESAGPPRDRAYVFCVVSCIGRVSVVVGACLGRGIICSHAPSKFKAAQCIADGNSRSSLRPTQHARMIDRPPCKRASNH